jgi:uroporphyrinogen-III synthase
MHLLVTRPEPDASEQKARLEAMGIVATIAPLLTVETEPIPAEALNGITGLIATSRNAIRALERSANMPAARTLPLFAVGPGTAGAARQAGFKAIITGPATAGELANVIKTRAPSGRLLHIAGETLAYDVAADLMANGIDVDTLTAYRIIPRETLQEDVSLGLQHDTFTGVILMSPMTAQAWCRTISEAHLETKAQRLVHICISIAVARKLEPLSPCRIATAEQPNGEEILALIARLAAQSA